MPGGLDAYRAFVEEPEQAEADRRPLPLTLRPETDEAGHGIDPRWFDRLERWLGLRAVTAMDGSDFLVADDEITITARSPVGQRWWSALERHSARSLDRGPGISEDPVAWKLGYALRLLFDPRWQATDDPAKVLDDIDEELDR